MVSLSFCCMLIKSMSSILASYWRGVNNAINESMEPVLSNSGSALGRVDQYCVLCLLWPIVVRPINKFMLPFFVFKSFCCLTMTILHKYFVVWIVVFNIS